MFNQDIRRYAKQYGVKLWQIANIMGISESTMTRLLRLELPEKDKTKIVRIIDTIAARNKENA